jgi:hypothetical protein
MSKIVRLTESELINVCKLLVENTKDILKQYEDTDLYDIFLNIFKEWARKSLSDDFLKKYPISYILRKYGRKFENDMGVLQGEEYENDDEEIIYSRYRVFQVLQELMEKENNPHHFPSMKSDVKFTETHADILKFVKEYLKIPDYVTIDFTEETPNEIDMSMVVDYEKFVTDNDDNVKKLRNFYYEIGNVLSDNFNVEFGNPIYGEVLLNHETIKVNNFDKWKKEIRKEIKKLPNSNIVEKINISNPHGTAIGQITIKFFYRHSNNTFVDRTNFINYVKSLLYNQKGINPKLVSVENYWY